MRRVLFVFAALVALPIASQAQVIPEVRPFVGALIPTGEQRDIFRNAVVSGVQVAVEARDMVHMVGTFAFSGPSFKGRLQNNDHTHIYQGDVGAELFRSFEANSKWMIRPFLGAGLGMRTYDFTGADPTRTYPAGFGALGAEFQTGNIALRLEARDYIIRYKGISGGDKASSRGEAMFTGGLVFHLR